MLRWLIMLSLTSLISCATLTGGPKKSGKSKATAEGEETGVTNIARRLREFNQALGRKEFDKATDLLNQTEAAVRSASEVTRSHPDFEDVTDGVATARRQLATAIELDRIARRNAAIDDTIQRGSNLVAQGSTLLQGLQARYPTDEDLDDLKEVIGALSKLRADGRQYEDEERYRQHAAVVDPKLTALDTRRRQAEWQHKAAGVAGAAIEKAYAAAQGVHDAASVTERVTGFREASTGFSACASAIADLERDSDYRADWLIETRLGALSVADTKKVCIDRAGKARQEADWRDWQDKVGAVIAALGPTMQATRGGKRASEALLFAQEAVAALRKCQVSLDNIAKHAGARAAQVFQTPLGNLAVAAFRQGCATEEARLVKLQPGLRWAAGLDDVVARLDELKAKMDQADATKESTKRIEAWRTVIAGFKECVETSHKVGLDPAADRALALTTVFGKLTVLALEKECSRLVDVGGANLKAATEAAELQKFIATCRGDEVSVAQREGIPTRVEPVNGGRVFVYARPGKGKAAAKIGFDLTGKQVDFRARWLDELNGLATDLNAAIESIRTAASGKEALEATESLMPLLSRCTESLAKTEQHPGHDAGATFTTALGKLTAVKLRTACGAEKSKRTTTLVPLGWRAKLEEVRDRAVEAQNQLESSKATRESQRRLEELAAASGGYTECIERADALVREPGADKNAKVKVGKNDVNLAALKKLCESELAQSRKETDKAAAQKDLEDFIAACRGDEAEVARREGMPTRVEKRARGRLFVYDGKGKSKAKRFAFNAEGRRIDEKALGAAAPTLEAIPTK